MQISDLQAQVQRLVARHANDPSAPGITLSFLPEREVFYASAVRYEKAFGNGKKRLAFAEGATLEATLEGLVKELEKLFVCSLCGGTRVVSGGPCPLCMREEAK